MSGLYDRLALLRRRWRFRTAYGFLPPEEWSDWSGYDALLDELGPRLEVPGHVLEIGVFLGGGTFKLSKFLERHAPGKRVFALDIFDPTFDATSCTEGREMRELYRDALAGRSQHEVFAEVTADCANLAVIEGDSAVVAVPEVALCFAFIDGNHDAAYVRSDFELAWSRLSPGGVVALHDYGFNIPQVTKTVHRLIGDHAEEIGRVWVNGITIFVERASARAA